MMIGVGELYNVSPVKIAREMYERDRDRRAKAAERIALYRDNTTAILQQTIDRLFDDPSIKAKLNKFISVAQSPAIFKRLVNEVAAPAYSTPPMRTVSPMAVTPFAQLEQETEYNARMDLACRLAHACNHVLLYNRFIPSLNKISIDIITPDNVTVIPHPDDPLVDAGLIYDRAVWTPNDGEVTWHVYWDNQQTFQYDHKWQLVPFMKGGPLITKHELARKPFAWVHRARRWGGFWDTTSGEDLVSAAKLGSILLLLASRLLKAQGFKQIVVSGDVASFPRGQSLDEEAAVLVPEGTSLQAIDLQSDATHYLSLWDAVKADVAANRGVSRARLNQDSAAASTDDGLTEARAETLQFMACAEREEFEVLAMVSREHTDPSRRIPPGSELLSVDFGEWQSRTIDPAAAFDLAAKKRAEGRRNLLDDIMRDNPEIKTEAEAEAEYTRNIEINSRLLALAAARNISQGATAEAPGQSPEENGANGPKVRDGEMTEKEAEAQAKSGSKKDVKAMAERMLEEAA